MTMTAGERIVRDNFPPWGKEKMAACALAIDTAIAASFQAGVRAGFNQRHSCEPKTAERA